MEKILEILFSCLFAIAVIFLTASILSSCFIISKNVYYDIRCKSECIEVFETAQEQQSCRTGCFLYDPPVIRELLEDEDQFRNIMTY